MATDPTAANTSPPPGMRRGVPLSRITTVELGGPARYLVTVDRVQAAVDVVRWARRECLPLAVIGGGSNVVAADRGWEGVVLQPAMRGIEVRRDRESAEVTVAAGEPWDEVVAMTVEEKLAGIECLSGIPGWAGATPIQNVGAYGQQVGEVIESVEVLDLESLDVSWLKASKCNFSYRGSLFRSAPGRYLVLTTVFKLRPGGAPCLRYEELARALLAGSTAPTLAEVRRAVLDLRRAKSMILDENDADRRSVGSFFLNPSLDAEDVGALQDKALAAGALESGEQVPTFRAEGGRMKVPAAWLVEKAGFRKGMRRGEVGISSRHALALVHHGGGTSAALVNLAREIQAAVRERFGVVLEPEPVFLGFATPDPLTN